MIYVILNTSPVSGIGPASPPPTIADLSISKTDGQTTAMPGESVTYTIVVTNVGPDRARDVLVVDNFPAILSGVVWVCSSSPGSQCGAGSGSGNINTTINVKPDGVITFIATGLISTTATGSLVNTAYLLPPADIVDPTPDDHSATDVDLLIPFSVTAVNDGPTTLGNATVFTATPSGGSGVTYQWAFGDGSNAAGNPVIHVYNAAASYTAVVTATNSIGITATTTTLVDVTNLAPLANAGPNQNVLVNANVMLDGSASADPDGHWPLTYQWRQSSGAPVVLNSSTISRPIFLAPSAPAVLAFTLVVTDAGGLASAPDQVVVTVGDRPISGLTAANSSPTTLGNLTTFTATITDGSNVIYQWDFGDDSLGSGNPAHRLYSAAGLYTVTIMAMNSAGLVTATTTANIINLAPLADAGPDQNVMVNANVTLDGSASADPDDHWPLTYQWQQIGGAAVVLNNRATSHPTFIAPGAPAVLTFTLVVTDARGMASPPDQVVVTVGDRPIIGLTAANSGPTTLGKPTIFTATISDGSNATYLWAFGDGSAAVGNPLTHIYTFTGAYTVIVTATNGAGSMTTTTEAIITAPEPISYKLYLPLVVRGGPLSIRNLRLAPG
jgi:uncharacterized repeat protein (TIGR01451 family)